MKDIKNREVPREGVSVSTRVIVWKDPEALRNRRGWGFRGKEMAIKL